MSAIEIFTPGAVIKRRMKDKGLSQKELAERMGMQPSHVSEIIRGKKPITRILAKKLALQFEGLDEIYWMNLQMDYEQKSSSNAILEDVPSQIIAEYDAIVNVKELCKLYGITSKGDSQKLEELRKKCDLPSADILRRRSGFLYSGLFRKSAKKGLDARMLATWIVIARNQAGNVEVHKFFDKQLLPELELELKTIFNENRNTISRLQKTFSRYGIRFCVVSKIDHASIDAYSYYENGIPNIIVTNRYNHIDSLAFNVLHELCHVVNHLGGDMEQNISLNDYDNDSLQEREANKYATSTLIPDEIWELAPTVPMNSYVIQNIYTRWAKLIQVNKWIVLGRISYETGIYRFKDDGTRSIK